MFDTLLWRERNDYINEQRVFLWAFFFFALLYNHCVFWKKFALWKSSILIKSILWFRQCEYIPPTEIHPQNPSVLNIHWNNSFCEILLKTGLCCNSSNFYYYYKTHVFFRGALHTEDAPWGRSGRAWLHHTSIHRGNILLAHHSRPSWMLSKPRAFQKLWQMMYSLIFGGKWV